MKLRFNICNDQSAEKSIVFECQVPQLIRPLVVRIWESITSWAGTEAPSPAGVQAVPDSPSEIDENIVRARVIDMRSLDGEYFYRRDADEPFANFIDRCDYFIRKGGGELKMTCSGYEEGELVMIVGYPQEYD